MTIAQRLCPSFITENNVYNLCTLETPQPIYPPDNFEFCLGINSMGGITGNSTYVEWFTVPNSDCYILQFSLNSNFQGSTLLGVEVVANNANPTQTLDIFANVHYFPNERTYWRVFAISKANNCASLIGQTRSFTYSCGSGQPPTPPDPNDPNADANFCEYFQVSLDICGPDNITCTPLCEDDGMGGTTVLTSATVPDADKCPDSGAMFSVNWSGYCADAYGNVVLEILGPVPGFGLWALYDDQGMLLNNGTTAAQPVAITDGESLIVSYQPVDAMGMPQTPVNGGVTNCICVNIFSDCVMDSLDTVLQDFTMTLRYCILLRGTLPNGSTVDFICCQDKTIEVSCEPTSTDCNCQCIKDAFGYEQGTFVPIFRDGDCELEPVVLCGNEGTLQCQDIVDLFVNPSSDTASLLNVDCGTTPVNVCPNN